VIIEQGKEKDGAAIALGGKKGENLIAVIDDG
jgi:hypothetical protein